jgi:hypothetical protein
MSVSCIYSGVGRELPFLALEAHRHWISEGARMTQLIRSEQGRSLDDVQQTKLSGLCSLALRRTHKRVL